MKRRRLEYIYYYFNKDRRAVVRKTAPRPGHRFPSPSGRRRGGGPQHLGGVWAWLGGGGGPGRGRFVPPGKLGSGGGTTRSARWYLQEWRHSMMVVASMKYPPQSTHMRWGFSSVILILVVRCILAWRGAALKDTHTHTRRTGQRGRARRRRPRCRDPARPLPPSSRIPRRRGRGGDQARKAAARGRAAGEGRSRGRRGGPAPPRTAPGRPGRSPAEARRLRGTHRAAPRRARALSAARRGTGRRGLPGRLGGDAAGTSGRGRGGGGGTAAATTTTAGRAPGCRRAAQRGTSASRCGCPGISGERGGAAGGGTGGGTHTHAPRSGAGHRGGGAGPRGGSGRLPLLLGADPDLLRSPRGLL